MIAWGGDNDRLQVSKLVEVGVIPFVLSFLLIGSFCPAFL